MKKLGILIFLFLIPLVVFAQEFQLMEKTKRLVSILILIVLTISVFEIIYSGFLFITAEGEPEKLLRAKNTLIYAIIGIGVAMIAWSLAQLVKSVMGV